MRGDTECRTHLRIEKGSIRSKKSYMEWDRVMWKDGGWRRFYRNQMYRKSDKTYSCINEQKIIK